MLATIPAEAQSMRDDFSPLGSPHEKHVTQRNQKQVPRGDNG